MIKILVVGVLLGSIGCARIPKRLQRNKGFLCANYLLDKYEETQGVEQIANACAKLINIKQKQRRLK